ncbi:MAG: TonB-dependent receptor [Alphaproteobacteria bacterium]
MKRVWGFHLAKLGLVAGGLLMAGSPAMAQIDEIVVTATKQSKALQDVSASVSAFSSDQLEARGLANAQDLAFGVPGLIYGETQGTPQITIRGIGLSVETGAAEEGVASYINGVVLPRAQLANLAFGDLERAEVLRGPQGTLYGRNATGGAINYITKRPTYEFEVSVSGEHSSFGTWSGEVAMAGPIIEDYVGVRVYARYKESDGYVENLSQYSSQDRLVGSEDIALRGTIVVKPFENVEVDLTLGHFAREGTFSSMQMTNLVGIPTPNLPSNDPYYTIEPNKAYHDFEDQAELNATMISARISWEFDDFELRSTTGFTSFDTYSLADGDFRDPRTTDPGLPLPLPLEYPSGDGNFALLSANDFEAFSQELSLTGEIFTDLNFVVGAFYLSTTGIFNIGPSTGANAVVPNTTVQDYRNDEDNESLGLFLDAAYSVTDWLRLLGGLRWGYDIKAVEQSENGPIPFATGYNQEDGSCDLDGELKWTNLSPKIGLEVDASDSIMIYGTYQQATKPGGYNIAECGYTFDQEEIAAFEIGVKTSLFDNRVTLNAAGFYYDYEDYQVFQITPQVTAEVLNAPKASIRGFEAEVAAQPFSFMRLDFGASYLDAKYDEFFAVDSIYKVPGLGLYEVQQDLAGNRLTRAPKYTLNAGLQFHIPINWLFLGNATLRLEGTHVDDVYFRQFNHELDLQEAYTVANLFISIASREGNVRLKGFIKNVTDEAYIVSQFSNPIELFVTAPDEQGRQSTFAGIYGPPRSIGVTLNVDF